jgi:hypothetical protein
MARGVSVGQRLHAKELSEFLDAELESEQGGLRLLRVGPSSPLREMVAVGDEILQASVENGDRIVAINGVVPLEHSNAISIASGISDWVVTVFDHRTRCTVSWRIRVRDRIRAV